jgi:hypothetical protein
LPKRKACTVKALEKLAMKKRLGKAATPTNAHFRVVGG